MAAWALAIRGAARERDERVRPSSCRGSDTGDGVGGAHSLCLEPPSPTRRRTFRAVKGAMQRDIAFLRPGCTMQNRLRGPRVDFIMIGRELNWQKTAFSAKQNDKLENQCLGTDSSRN
jgi:hypothetical protein